jgi:uncharacterized protein
VGVGSEVNSMPRSHVSTGSTPLRLPVRTCVGCKEKAPTADLLRVVVSRSDGESQSSDCIIVPDVEHRLPGRGAWLHLDRNCLHNAERRRAFGRALRVPGAIDISAVDAFVERRVLPDEKNRQQH